MCACRTALLTSSEAINWTGNSRSSSPQPLSVRATTVPYEFEHADDALADLAAGRFSGAAVLHVS